MNGFHYVWTGMTYEGNWKYLSDETPVELSNWGPGGPGTGPCAVMLVQWNAGTCCHKKWASTSCSQERRFVCESTTSTLDACPLGSDPSKYKTVSGNCYFYDNTPRRFVDAEANCQISFGSIGGYSNFTFFKSKNEV